MILRRHQLPMPLSTQDEFIAVTLPDRVDIVILNDRWRLDLAARESKHTDLGRRFASLGAFNLDAAGSQRANNRIWRLLRDQ